MAGKKEQIALIFILFFVFASCNTNGEDNNSTQTLEDKIRKVIETHVKVGAMVGIIRLPL